jgi:hypothetical protein
MRNGRHQYRTVSNEVAPFGGVKQWTDREGISLRHGDFLEIKTLSLAAWTSEAEI